MSPPLTRGWQVNIGLRVLTRPIPNKLPEIYRTLGTEYAERVLPSIIQVSIADIHTLQLTTVSVSAHRLAELVKTVGKPSSCAHLSHRPELIHVQETLKSVIAQYNASQLLTMREVCPPVSKPSAP